MTNIWKRSIAMILALVMVFGMVPVGVLAEETEAPAAEVTEAAETTEAPETQAPETEETQTEPAAALAPETGPVETEAVEAEPGITEPMAAETAVAAMEEASDAAVDSVEMLQTALDEAAEMGATSYTLSTDLLMIEEYVQLKIPESMTLYVDSHLTIPTGADLDIDGHMVVSGDAVIDLYGYLGVYPDGSLDVCGTIHNWGLLWPDAGSTLTICSGGKVTIQEMYRDDYAENVAGQIICNGTLHIEDNGTLELLQGYVANVGMSENGFLFAEENANIAVNGSYIGISHPDQAENVDHGKLSVQTVCTTVEEAEAVLAYAQEGYGELKAILRCSAEITDSLTVPAGAELRVVNSPDEETVVTVQDTAMLDVQGVLRLDADCSLIIRGDMVISEGAAMNVYGGVLIEAGSSLVNGTVDLMGNLRTDPGSTLTIGSGGAVNIQMRMSEAGFEIPGSLYVCGEMHIEDNGTLNGITVPFGCVEVRNEGFLSAAKNAAVLLHDDVFIVTESPDHIQGIAPNMIGFVKTCDTLEAVKTLFGYMSGGYRYATAAFVGGGEIADGLTIPAKAALYLAVAGYDEEGAPIPSSLTVNEGAVLEVQGSLILDAGYTLSVKGSMVNKGSVDNSGQVAVYGTLTKGADWNGNDPVWQEGGQVHVTLAELQTALDAAAAAGEYSYTVMGDVTVTESATLTIPADMTLFVDGAALTVERGGALTLACDDQYANVEIINGGSLTVRGALDCCTELNVFDGDIAVAEDGVMTLQMGHSASIGNGTFDLRGELLVDGSLQIGMETGDGYKSAVMNVYGTVTNQGGLCISAGYDPEADAVTEKSKMNVYSGGQFISRHKPEDPSRGGEALLAGVVTVYDGGKLELCPNSDGEMFVTGTLIVEDFENDVVLNNGIFIIEQKAELSGVPKEVCNELYYADSQAAVEAGFARMANSSYGMDLMVYCNWTVTGEVSIPERMNIYVAQGYDQETEEDFTSTVTVAEGAVLTLGGNLYLNQNAALDVRGDMVVSETGLLVVSLNDQWSETTSSMTVAGSGTVRVDGTLRVKELGFVTNNGSIGGCGAFDILGSWEGREATQHTVVTDPAVAATCTESGLTEGKHCSACSEVLVKQETVAALGHAYVDGVCRNCGAQTEIPLTEEYFPDKKFRTYLAKNVDDDENDLLSQEELDAVTDLDLGELGIGSLEGIRYFKNLVSLSCEDNQLTSLDLSGNTALMELYCSENQLAALDLSANTALEFLGCLGNQLSTLDLRANTALTDLECSNNQLTNLDISGCTSLKSLSCWTNRLSTLDVTKNTALTELACAENQLTKLDVSKNLALTELVCGYNCLTELDVSSNTALTELVCGDNPLTKLDVSRNTSLTRLLCWDNQLTQLDVSKNTALLDLYCDENQLTELDLSANPDLCELRCNDNQLTVLDLSSNRALTYLECDGNQLSSLDLSSCDSMERLLCDANRVGILQSATGSFDLTALPGFDVSKASKWKGGKVSGTVLSVNSGKDTVTYTYDCGSGMRAVFTLEVLNPFDMPTGVTIYYADEEAGKTLDVALNENMTFQLDSQVAPSTAKQAVLWSCSPASVATINDNGLLTFRKPGTVTVTAKAADNTKKKDTLKITGTYQVESMEITSKDGKTELASGKSLTLKVSFTPEKPTNKKVTWEILSGEEYAAVSSSGKVTASRKLEYEQKVQVRATAKDGSGVTAVFDLTVFPLVTKVQIDAPAKVDMTVNKTLQLTANTVPAGASGEVTWKSSSSKVATVDADGNVTFLKPGTVTITATAADGSGKKDTHKIKVTKTMDTLNLPATAIVAAKKSLKMTKLEGYEVDPLASNKKLTWTLTDENGEKLPTSVATISSAGVLKAKAIKDGKPVVLKVHAAAKDGSGLTASCTVTVYPDAIKKMELRDEGGKKLPKTVEVPLDGSVTLWPAVTSPADVGSTALGDSRLSMEALWSVACSKDGWVQWRYEDGAIVLTPGENAVSGKTAKVTVKAGDGSGKSASVTLKFS